MQPITKNPRFEAPRPPVRQVVRLDPSTAWLLCHLRQAQAEIARLAGCSRQYVGVVLHGQKRPSARVSKAIERFFQRRRRPLARLGLHPAISRSLPAPSAVDFVGASRREA